MTTLADLLFEPQADAATELAAALGRNRALIASLSATGLSVPGVEVANAMATLLEMPIGNIALRGWKEHRSVAEARHRTAGTPGSREVIRLLEHRIKSKQEPVIEAEVNGVSIPLLALTLDVELRLSTADVIVEAGQVVDIRPGSSVAKVSLSASKVVLAEKEFRQVDLRNRAQPAPGPPPPPSPPPPQAPPPYLAQPSPDPGQLLRHEGPPAERRSRIWSDH